MAPAADHGRRAACSFIVYATFRAFQNAYYFSEPYISPVLLAVHHDRRARATRSRSCSPGPAWISPALYILIFPLGIRLTCYYYRKAYYRSFWLSPPACAVAEPHRRYTGESRLPLLGQNLHRYALYAALVINVILSYDAVLGFRDETGEWGHMGLGTADPAGQRGAALALLAVVPLVPAHRRRPDQPLLPAPAALQGVDAGVAAERPAHAVRLASLFSVAFADFYVFLLATGTISDLRFF